jgi:hypothetical protein
VKAGLSEPRGSAVLCESNIDPASNAISIAAAPQRIHRLSRMPPDFKVDFFES